MSLSKHVQGVNDPFGHSFAASISSCRRNAGAACLYGQRIIDPKHMKPTLLALTVLLSGGARAQEPDYFPLQVGNQWVLESPASPPETLNIEVLRSRVINGQTYYLVTSYGPGDLWLRKTAEGVLYAWNESKGADVKVAHLRFGAPPYWTSLSGCEQYAQPSDIGLAYEGPNGPALPMTYAAGSCADIGFTLELYRPDVGLSQRSIVTFRGPVTFNLAYARVNGKAVTRPDKSLVLRSDFDRGSRGWLAGFTDYSLQTGDLRMLAETRPLPQEINEQASGFYLQSMNRSDDMFMYLKKHVGAEDGLQPNQAYRLSFDIVFASNAPSGCAGVGGAPGESVYLKAGASADESVAVLRSGGAVGINIDKGQQATGGRDAGIVGNVANGRECTGVDWPYVRLRKSYTHAAPVRTDIRGTLWLVVGTDSGFEGLTGLYYESITARLTPVME